MMCRSLGALLLAAAWAMGCAPLPSASPGRSGALDPSLSSSAAAPAPASASAPLPVAPPLPRNASRVSLSVAAAASDLALFPFKTKVLAFSMRDAHHASFAVSGPGGLEPAPELSKGFAIEELNLFQAVVGDYPDGALWMDAIVRDGWPMAIPLSTALFRFEKSGWKRSGAVKTGDVLAARWLVGDCLWGLRVGSILPGTAGARRGPIDCPREGASQKAIRGPREPDHAIRGLAVTPAGDLFLVFDTYDGGTGYRVEMVGAKARPPAPLLLLPLGEGMGAGESLDGGNLTLVARSASEAYLLGITQGRSPSRPILYRFDGQSWTVMALPTTVGISQFALSDDGALLVAVDPTGMDADVALWVRPPSGEWRLILGSTPEPQACNANRIVARSLDNIWIECWRTAHAGRILHTGETKTVWRPETFP